MRILIASLLVLAAACGGGPSAPSASVAGQWTGTTSQGQTFTFTVGSDLKLTALGFGYSFNGCTGSMSFTPDVALTTVPTAPVPVYSALYESGPVGSANRAIVTFLFTSSTEAHGMAVFTDFPGCGTGLTLATWTATKR